MSLTYKPKHPFAKDLNIFECNHKIGRITYPWGHIFMKYGRAKMVINKEVYSMNFPVRDFGYIGKDRIVAMTLFLKDKEIAKVYFQEAGLVEGFSLEYNNQKFNGKMIKANTFTLFDEGKVIVNINFFGFLFKKCTVETEGFPLEVTSLVVWALHNPLRFI